MHDQNRELQAESRNTTIGIESFLSSFYVFDKVK